MGKKFHIFDCGNHNIFSVYYPLMEFLWKEGKILALLTRSNWTNWRSPIRKKFFFILEKNSREVFLEMIQ